MAPPATPQEPPPQNQPPPPPPQQSQPAGPAAASRADSDVLKAFKPQRVLGLPSGERAKIESLQAYSDRLLVGLSNGTLLVYTVDDPLSAARPKVALLHTMRGFATRAIDQIGVLRDAGFLVVLADAVVSVYDLESLALDETLSKTKGATTFAITFGVQHEKPQEEDEEAPAPPHADAPLTTVSRLVVACRRRLICYEWRDSEFTEYKEINMPDRIKSLSFLQLDKVVCGLNSDYCIVDVHTGAISNVALPGTHAHSSFTSVGISYMGIGGRSPFPHSTALHDHTAFLVKDAASQFVDEQGHLLDRPAIHWQAPPEALGYTYPYLICVLPKHVEIRNPQTTTLLQTIEVAGVKALNCGKFTCVATQNQVYRLMGTDLRKQVETLATKPPLLGEAISILDSVDSAFVPGRLELLRQLKILKAVDMLKSGRQFEPALALFSSISAPPSVVIELFPPQISGSGEDLIKYMDSVPPTRFLHSRTLSSSSTRSNSRSSKDRRVVGSSSSSSSGNGSSNGAKPDSTVKSPQPLSRTNSASPVPDSPTDAQATPAGWSDKELTIAVRSLVNFLADTRRKIALISTADDPVDSTGLRLTKETYGGDLDKTADLVDTAMFKCYVMQSPALIGPLLRIHNHCDAEVVRTVLSHNGKWRELIDFYFGKKFHREALELLRELAGSTRQNGAAPNTPDYLKGPEPTVRYLQRLNNASLELIFEFARWPIGLNEALGEDIFLEDSDESESLSRDRVLAYLEDTSRSLTIKYLEHVIFDKHEENGAFHTALAINYIKALASIESDKEVKELPEAKDADAATVRSVPPNVKAQQQKKDEAAAAAALFDKLVVFLKAKDSRFKLSKVLGALPARSAECSRQQLEIKAILYGKQGDSRTALMIYTFELADDAKARAFCGEIYDESPEQGRKALHTLMALYLTPPPASEVEGEEGAVSGNGARTAPAPRLDLALDLLATQGSRMSVVDIINTLPPGTTIRDIAVFLTSQIRALRTSWNGAQLDAALRRVHLVKAQEALLAQQQRRATTITSLRTCRVCFKRLGHSVISVFPDGTAIHYGCARAYQQALDDERLKAKTRAEKRDAPLQRSAASRRDSVAARQNV